MKIKKSGSHKKRRIQHRANRHTDPHLDLPLYRKGQDQSGLDNLTSPVLEDEIEDIDFDKELREVSSFND